MGYANDAYPVAGESFHKHLRVINHTLSQATTVNLYVTCTDVCNIVFHLLTTRGVVVRGVCEFAL